MRKVTVAMIIFWSALALVIFIGLVSGIIFQSRASSSTHVSSGEWELMLDESFSIDGVQVVEVSMASDEVYVYASDNDEIRVIQHGQNLSKERVLAPERNGPALSIQIPDNFSFQFDFGLNQKSRVEIYLPDQYDNDLELDLASGSIDIERTLHLRDLDLDLSSGRIHGAEAITADELTVEAASGSVRLSSAHCQEYQIDISSGNVHVDELSGSGSIEAASGKIIIPRLDIAEELKIHISSGNVQVGLIGNPALEFEGDKSSGTIRTYFQTNQEPDDSSHLYATVGEPPRKKIDVDIASGSVTIEQA